MKTESRPSSESFRPFAVIDIGASSLRLRVAELSPEGRVHTLESLQRAVHLGKDSFTTGRIQSATIEECIEVLRDFRRIMAQYGITREDQIRAVATSAIREAENCNAVLDRFYMSTQINVEAIEGAEENRLTYLAVQDVLEKEPKIKITDTIIVDVGGGSTELLLLQEGKVSFANNYLLGSLRMRETLETYRAPAERIRTILEQHIRRTVDQLYRSTPVDKVPSLIAVSGDAQFAASLLSPGWAEGRLSRMDVKTFTGLADKLVPVPVDEIVRQYKIPFQEAETIGPALLAYALVARAFKVREIIVPKCSLRDGLLREVAQRGSWTREFAEQAIHSAMQLGQKCNYDEKHASQVAELSLKFFRELQPEHQLDQRFELLLHIAALLHEVGLFISDRKHHKHSMYIILNSDLFGLSRKDIGLIAVVARYHRRSTPRAYHVEFQALPRDSRIIVVKLAAILRVADALDRNHMQTVRDISFSREKGQFIITVQGATDLTLERLAMKEKGDMFHEIYGLTPVLRSARPTKEVMGDA
jgi:exopolyphosphatase/guanosine-5'-triphosphate,3'-diphosphate pyrophosphatase